FDHPVVSLDITATALHAAGVDVKPDWKLDGVSLIPHFSGAKKIAPPHQFLFWRFGAQMAVREGDWKLVRPSRGKGEYEDIAKDPMLFNLADDPGEATDLAAKHPDKVQRLQAAWDKWNAENIEPRWPATAKGKTVPMKP